MYVTSPLRMQQQHFLMVMDRSNGSGRPKTEAESNALSVQGLLSLSLSLQIKGMFGSAPCETKAGAVASGVTFFFGFISFACPPANMVLALIKRPAGAVDRIVRLVWLL